MPIVFNHRRAFRELAEPAVNSLSTYTQTMFDTVRNYGQDLERDSRGKIPYTDISPNILAAQNRLTLDEIAAGSIAYGAYGSWCPVDKNDPAYWRFANIADQILRGSYSNRIGPRIDAPEDPHWDIRSGIIVWVGDQAVPVCPCTTDWGWWLSREYRTPPADEEGVRRMVSKVVERIPSVGSSATLDGLLARIPLASVLYAEEPETTEEPEAEPASIVDWYTRELGSIFEVLGVVKAHPGLAKGCVPIKNADQLGEAPYAHWFTSGTAHLIAATTTGRPLNPHSAPCDICGCSMADHTEAPVLRLRPRRTVSTYRAMNLLKKIQARLEADGLEGWIIDTEEGGHRLLD